jgi:hypothetical protein
MLEGSSLLIRCVCFEWLGLRGGGGHVGVSLMLISWK